MDAGPLLASAGAATATPPVMIEASAATVRMIRFIVGSFLCHPGWFALRDGRPRQVAAVAAGDLNREGRCFSAAIRPNLAAVDGQSAQQAIGWRLCLTLVSRCHRRPRTWSAVSRGGSWMILPT